MMKVAIIGSRSYTDYDRLKYILDALSEKINIDLIVSGGAKGADTLGYKYAIENNIKTLIFKPEWDKYGKIAGFIRNEQIVKSSDIVLAFWDGISNGTKNSIGLCEKYNIKYHIIKF